MGGWTTQQVNKAVSMWKEGNTATEIARRISKSRNAVIGKLNRLGVKKPNTTTSMGTSQIKDGGQITSSTTGSKQTKSKKVDPTPERPLEDQRLTLLFLNEKTCRWPIGDPSTKNFWFCGKPCLPNKRYCVQHSELAFQPNPVKKERSELQARVITRPYAMASKSTKLS